MKLIILGNGFDLHHGLDTRFSSFRSYLQSIGKTELVDSIDTIIIRNVRERIDTERLTLAWNDIEKILNLEYERIRADEYSLNEFENSVEDFIFELFKYLKDVSDIDITVNDKIREHLSNADAFLVFNYTNTYETYIEDKSTKIFHIHGCLDEQNCPLIGYYNKSVIINNKSNDYRIRYSNSILHKSAMAYKQNGRILENEIIEFTEAYKNKIDEIVVIGYSFGESDNHIYKILNDVLINQTQTRNMKYDEAEKLQKIYFRIFNYNDNETNGLIKKITDNFSFMFKRNAEVMKFGIGIKRQTEKIICFEKIQYY